MSLTSAKQGSAAAEDGADPPGVAGKRLGGKVKEQTELLPGCGSWVRREVICTLPTSQR